MRSLAFVLFFLGALGAAHAQIPPMVELSVNNGHDNVLVPYTEPVEIHYTVIPFSGAGTPVDVWIVLKTPFGFFSYDGTGGIPQVQPGWHTGLSNVFYSGPLGTGQGWAMRDCLPPGHYTVYLGLDTVPDGRLSVGAFAFKDVIDFEVFRQEPLNEDFNDGVANDWIPSGREWGMGKGTYCLKPNMFAGDYLSCYGKCPYADFTLTAEMRSIDTGNTSPNTERGLVFRSNGTLDDCYTLVISDAGIVDFQRREYGTTTSLWSGSPTGVVPGVGQWNTLRVTAVGPNFDIYVNGALEAQIRAPGPQIGYIGLIGECEAGFDSQHEFDNVTAL